MSRFLARTIILISTLVILISPWAFSIEKEYEAVPGEYLVKIKSNSRAILQDKVLLGKQLDADIKSVLESRNIVVIRKPIIQTTSSVIKSLLSKSFVERIEPNLIYRINKAPNDPLFDQLWGLHNSTNSGIDISAKDAWDIETGSDSVIVAVIDTGIDYNHPDLSGNIWTNSAELNGKAGVDDDNNGVIDDIHGYNAILNSGDPMDDHGHGTHCAGTIGGTGDDNQGVVGVAWKTKLMGVKFLSGGGSGTLEDAVKAIDYANKMGAKVMSNSWGGGGFTQTLFDIIADTNKSGAIFIAAAGNSYNDNDASPSYPASYQVPNIVSVAAIDRNGNKASFSNYGKKSVHVAAPGVGILSSTPGGQHQTMSGTSMATPHVSGIAALIFSNSPNLTAVEVKERLIKTSVPKASLKGKVLSGGITNAYYALTDTLPPPDQNDPSGWAHIPFLLESAHPYMDNSNVEFQIEAPGANEFSIYFEEFLTEESYDELEIYDESGALVTALTGELSQSYSPIIKGSKAKLVLKSDDSVTEFGFLISKIAIR